MFDVIRAMTDLEIRSSPEARPRNFAFYRPEVAVALGEHVTDVIDASIEPRDTAPQARRANEFTKTKKIK